MKNPLLPIAWGEVFDKHSILVTKKLRLTDPAKLRNVQHELWEIEKVLQPHGFGPELAHAYRELLIINGSLWNIEDGKRQCEKEQRFDAHFIQLARQVYLLNDQRAALKRKINVLLDSDIIEEKSYA